MRLEVLGCDGGSGPDQNTTSFLINDNILLDCGTGAANIAGDRLHKVQHVVLTHAHFDHIAELPMLLIRHWESFRETITVYGLQDTLDALKEHVFNDKLWPNLTVLPNSDQPMLRYKPLSFHEVSQIGGCNITLLPVNHSVPTGGVMVKSMGRVFAFTGDTTTNDRFWSALNNSDRLDLLFVECSFANREIDLCYATGHYCPQLLAEDLVKLKHHPLIGISHMKSGKEISLECKDNLLDWNISSLQTGMVFMV